MRRKLLSTHLSKELKQKYNRRNITVVTGDKVKVQRGQFKGHTGKVEEIDLKKGRVFVSGMDLQKKDGNKIRIGVVSSNIVITDLNLDDKKRNQSINKKKE
jgi:large subunit ribosomal protein L24